MNLSQGICTWGTDMLQVHTHGNGLYAFTHAVEERLPALPNARGLCHLFIMHTSASLMINESYDPSARLDFETFLERLAPENQPWMRHTLEGSDDSSSHLRAGLLPTSLSIPIEGGQLGLGRWQGIFLVEHRNGGHYRQVHMNLLLFTSKDSDQ